MSYAIFTETPGNLEDYETVNAMVPSEPEGLLLRIAGATERGLGVLAVWRSREDADRFFTDHLGPALATVVGDPVPPPLASCALDQVQVWEEG